MFVSLAGGRPQMRKDKKADSRICGKTCPKNRTVSSSLEQSISAESVSHAGMRKKRTAGCFLCTCGRE